MVTLAPSAAMLGTNAAVSSAANDHNALSGVVQTLQAKTGDEPLRHKVFNTGNLCIVWFIVVVITRAHKESCSSCIWYCHLRLPTVSNAHLTRTSRLQPHDEKTGFFPQRPYSPTVSPKYLMIEGPSAIAFLAFHGLNEKPKVCISLSDRIPGYLNRSQVPPKVSRRSRMPTLLPGHAFSKCTASADHRDTSANNDNVQMFHDNSLSCA